ncbi:hypothetical protein N8261_04670 [Flavobacteriaceae bacterium]|nr:hypothetical protein [Flavobacteriaceae bacterium]
MVKNNGGNKSKKMGRKFLSAPVDRRVRLAMEEGEIYGVVTKLFGNGMFSVNDPDGKERLVVMRNKFRGRGKRDNTVAMGGWVLIGERDYESCAKPKHDLLEVYTDVEKNKLKKSGNPLLLKLKSEYDTAPTVSETDDSLFEFTNKSAEQYNDMASVIDNIDTNTLKTIVMDTGDEVDVDDI